MNESTGMHRDDSEKQTYRSWLNDVLELLMTKHSRIYNYAICAGVDGKVVGGLEALRGDEPYDAWENDDAAQEYVNFLVEEWAIYGPEGE